MGVAHRPSPHHDQRPVDTVVDLLVVHGISLPPGEFGGPWIDDLFLGNLDPNAHPYFATLQGLRVAAHCLIRRNGDLSQYVSFQHRAWHAGQSRYGDRECCNDFSIGVELEGTDQQPYEDVQYQRLALLIRSLQQVYPTMHGERIVGHEHIAPGRKTDPGPAFDWQQLRRELDSGT